MTDACVEPDHASAVPLYNHRTKTKDRDFSVKTDGKSRPGYPLFLIVSPTQFFFRLGSAPRKYFSHLSRTFPNLRQSSVSIPSMNCKISTFISACTS
jgi:hypothetical protein